MTGWRIGWVLGPKPLVDACAALISHSTQCPAAFAQVGAVEALTGPQKLVQDLLAEYRRRRDFIHAAVAAIPGVTCVAARRRRSTLFPNVARYLGPAGADTLDLAARLLEEQKVAVVPGEGFAAPGYLRDLVRAVDGGAPGGRAAHRHVPGGAARATDGSRLAQDGSAGRVSACPKATPSSSTCRRRRRRSGGCSSRCTPAGVVAARHRPGRLRRLDAPGGARRGADLGLDHALLPDAPRGAHGDATRRSGRISATPTASRARSAAPCARCWASEPRMARGDAVPCG